MKKSLILFLFFSVQVFFGQSNDIVFAENYFRNNEFEKAIIYYEKLTKRSVYNVNYISRLVTCYQELGKYNKAELILSERLKNNSRMVFLNVLLGENFEKQGKKLEANQSFEKAVNGIEKLPNYGKRIANVFRNINKLDFAIKAYQKTAQSTQRDFSIQIAELNGEQGKFQKMFDAYLDYIDENSGGAIFNIQYRVSKYITDDAENETNILFKKSLLKRSQDNPKSEWNELLAWLFAKQKDYFKALIQHKAIQARGKNNLNKIKRLGKIAFEDKAYEDAYKCYETVFKKAEQDYQKIEGLSFMLKIKVAMKDSELDGVFTDAFEKFGVNRNTINIQLVYTNYLTFIKNNPEEAKKVLEKALTFAKSGYQKAEIKLELANLLVYQNKFNKALIYFSQVQTKFPNHVLGQRARFKVAQTSYFKTDFKWAKTQLKVLKSSASQLIANDATDLFLTISDNEPKDSIPTGLSKFAKANLYAFQNKNVKAVSILNELLKVSSGQEIQDDTLFELAKLYTIQKQFPEAIKCYEKIIKINKDGIFVDDSLYHLAEIYSEQNEDEKAKSYYEKIVLDYPSSIYLVNARKKFRKLRGDNI